MDYDTRAVFWVLRQCCEMLDLTCSCTWQDKWRRNSQGFQRTLYTAWDTRPTDSSPDTPADSQTWDTSILITQHQLSIVQVSFRNYLNCFCPLLAKFSLSKYFWCHSQWPALNNEQNRNKIRESATPDYLVCSQIKIFKHQKKRYLIQQLGFPAYSSQSDGHFPCAAASMHFLGHS